jgi:hypothetical protein
MDWEILYYNKNVQELINDWPVGIRAFYARVTERMETFGPNLRCPSPAVWEKAYLKFGQKAKKALVAFFSAQS